MKRAHTVAKASLAALLLALSASASAQAAAHATIGDAALAGASGRIALNQSAGAGNAQANLAAIASGPAAAAGLDNRQQAVRRAASGAATAEIDGAAFSGARGVIAVNQASGNGNVQANLVALAAGRFAEVSVDQLGSVRAASDTQGAASPDPTPERKAAIADSAFAGAAGIVQVNQAAGAGNNTANLFSLGAAVPH